jgi:hypothetical protein
MAGPSTNSRQLLADEHVDDAMFAALWLRHRDA